MPIKIPAELPAYKALDSENIFVMTDERAERQDIRPLEIVIVNLMPTKISTEIQLLRLLGNSPLQVNITLLRTAGHISGIRPCIIWSVFIRPLMKSAIVPLTACW